MIFIKPQLQTLEKNKLYLSRRPSIITWSIVGLLIVVLIEICKYFIENSFILTIILFGSIIFALDIVGNWEDMLLDRNQSFAIVTKYVWSEKLFLANLEKAIIINLNDIRHIGASRETGLFFLSKTGRMITFNTSGLTREEVQNMKKRISQFLDINKMHNSGPLVASSYHEKCSSASEYEVDEKFETDVKYIGLPKLYSKINRSSDKLVTDTSNNTIHSNKSTPAFGNNIDKQINPN